MMNKIITTALLMFLTILNTFAQESEQRSGILNSKENFIGIATGLDYSILPLTLNYQRGVKISKLKYAVNLGAEVTIPTLKFDFNDIRLKLLSEMTILRKKNFEIRGGINPMLIRTKMETETMTSLGSDFHFFTGFTNEKWNFGIKVNYNQIFSTYITHTSKYRDNVFQGAVDGWYKNTAANFRTGIFVNRTIRKMNIYVDGGISKTGKFKNYLFVPTMYAMVGLTYRIEK